MADSALGNQPIMNRNRLLLSRRGQDDEKHRKSQYQLRYGPGAMLLGYGLRS